MLVEDVVRDIGLNALTTQTGVPSLCLAGFDSSHTSCLNLEQTLRSRHVGDFQGKPTPARGCSTLRRGDKHKDN